MPPLPKAAFFVRLYALIMETPQGNKDTEALTPNQPPAADEGGNISPKLGEGGSKLKGARPIDKAALISLSMELGYIIAIPLVILALLGKWGDKHWHHSFPWMTLVGILLAIVSTTVWLTKKLKAYIK